LRLETGRYEQLALEQRVCFNCDNVVEDEVHVLLECPLYADIRNSLLGYARLIHNDFDSLNNCDKICCLLSTNNHVFIRQCAKACNDILCSRSRLLYG
jgi:hypothetical protein